MGSLSKLAVIESLLFVWGDPLDIRDISKILDIDRGETEYLLNELARELENKNRGLRLKRVKDTYQIGTKTQCYPWIIKLNKNTRDQNLSNAAMETLSIIAYKQPIIKSEIELIRGVKSDSAIYTLLDKGLIDEKGRLEKIGRPIVYGTTDLFLKSFGLENLEQLPSIENFKMDDDSESLEEE